MRTIRMVQKLLSKTEVAEILCVTVRMVDKLVERRKLERIKVGRLTRFRQSAVERYLEAQTC